MLEDRLCERCRMVVRGIRIAVVIPLGRLTVRVSSGCIVSLLTYGSPAYNVRSTLANVSHGVIPLSFPITTIIVWHLLRSQMGQLLGVLRQL